MQLQLQPQPRPQPVSPRAVRPLGRGGQYLVLTCAFLGWFCAGFHMSITSLAMQPAAVDLLDRTGALNKQQYQTLSRLAANAAAGRSSRQPVSISSTASRQLEQWKATVQRWFAWYQCAFLFGAASGGLFFGRLGDQWGRARAMGLSILTYSCLAAVSYFAQTPWMLLGFWFLACMGVGGMWPNGVALVSEVWAHMSRPLVAGLIGTSANIGLFLFATLASYVAITPESWRWVMLIATAPLLLAMFSLCFVPESPRWLLSRTKKADDELAAEKKTSTWEIFRPPLLTVTLIGITLAAIPMIGAWGSANWMIPWAAEAGDAADPPNPYLKARVHQARSMAGLVGSLLGGWIGSYFGRRRSYFIVSLAALGIAQYTFWQLNPLAPTFLWWVAALGFFSGIYFGWLPLCLPELFSTRVRSTGAGVSFNFGRILTAITVFATGALMALFNGQYPQIGRVTSLIFACGMLAICFAPDTSKKQLDD